MAESTVDRNRLFFGEFTWCAKFYMRECHALRELDHGQIDRVIQARRKWGRTPVLNYGGSWRSDWETRNITDAMVDDLHKMCDLLQAHTASRKMVIRENYLYIYSNDRNLFDHVKDSGLCTLENITSVRITGSPNAITLRHSDHAWRSYLRAKQLQPGPAQSAKSFLLVQESLRLSPSLASWCSHDRTYVWPHFFIDHNDRTLGMLELIAPDMIRCTLPIKVHK